MPLIYLLHKIIIIIFPMKILEKKIIESSNKSWIIIYKINFWKKKNTYNFLIMKTPGQNLKLKKKDLNIFLSHLKRKKKMRENSETHIHT